MAQPLSEERASCGLTVQQVCDIGCALLGTCDYPEAKDELAGIDLTDIDVDTLLSDLVTHAKIEMCCGCGWWFEEWELDGDYKCPDCSEEATDGE